MANNNIIIRELSDLQSHNLEYYKQEFGYKTSSKAVLSMIEHYPGTTILVEEQRGMINALEEENESLKKSISDFVNSFKNLSLLVNK